MSDLSELATPFDLSDLEWRVSRAGEKNGRVWAMILTYITARAIMERLDAVCGVDGWQTKYRDIGGSLACGIGIWSKPEVRWVWKWDGTGHLATNDGLDSADAGKGDFSNALKRAGVQWGIGRYLYGLTESFAKVHDQGAFKGKTKEGKWFRWDPPDLPAWARPNGDGEADPDVRDAIRTLLDQATAGCHINGTETQKIEDALADDEIGHVALLKTQAVLTKWIAEGREAEAVSA